MSLIQEMINKARTAQKKWEQADQQNVDKVVREIAKAVHDNAEYFAKITVEETGLGTYEFNVSQDMRKSEILWNSLKGKKSRGIINRIDEIGITEVAKPVGIVGVVLPVTIPVTNFMSNGMFSLKCGNSVIYAPHPKAKNTIAETARLVLEAISQYDVPEDLIQYIAEPSIDLTRELMSAVDVVVATGGMGMVKSAYSSGKPAYGVGPGNVQCIIDRDADIDDAVKKIIASRVFNLGIPCACEQAVMAPRENFDKIVDSFKRNKAAYIEDDATIAKLTKLLFNDKGELNRECIGIHAHVVAKMVGVDIPEDTEILLLKGDVGKQENVIRKEKLCPITIIYPYDSIDEAIELANSNLELTGKGHSAVIHSKNDDNIKKFALAHPVSRMVVNQACNFTAGGGHTIGFSPTTTLGCGTWGNNIISENLTYKHLMNVTRIGYPIPADKIPTSEEVWAE